MEFSLTGQKGEEFSFTLTITKAEAAQLDGAALTALWGMIRQQTGANFSEEQPEKKNAQKSAGETVVVSGYKGILLEETPQEDPSALYETLLSKLIETNPISLPDSLEEEIQVAYRGALQSLKYRRMFGDFYEEASADTAETDPEQLYAAVSAEVARDYREGQILKSIVAQEGLDCSAQELEEEALAMAKRENCSLDMIKMFMGEDYAFLKGDLLKKKAKKLICDTAQIRTK